MTGRSSSRERILDAAEAVALELGAAHMTMDAVAERAKVSKGGLIYHFPSIRVMLMAMLQRFTDLVEASIRGYEASLPESPARPLKAHILGLCSLFEEQRRTAQALLAVSARDPHLLDAARAKRRAMMDALLRAADGSERAAILILATEGMWTSQLLGVSALTHAERERLKDVLLNQADEWFGAKPAEGRRRPATGRRRKGART